MRLLAWFCLAIILGSFAYYGSWYVGVLMVFFCLLLVLVRAWRILLVALFALFVIALRILLFETGGIGTVSHYEVGVVELRGEICREVDYRREKIQYTVCLQQDRQSFVPVSGKILVVAPLYPRFSFGDLVDVKGRLTIPEQIEDFDYDRYLWRFGISRILYRPQIDLIEEGQGIMAKLFVAKDIFLGRINRSYHEPYASFLAGLLVGYRGGLSDELADAFQRTGLTHIVAISGANVALVILLVEKLLVLVPKKLRLGVIVLFLAIFCLLVGLSASVVRATIMGSLVLVARYYGRDLDVVFLLLLTAALMVMVIPPIAVYDAGFQLSFLAVLGIIFLSERIESYCSFLDSYPLLKEALVMTLAAQLGTLPLSLYLFKLLPWHAVVINMIVAPILPIAMMLGALSLVFVPLVVVVTLLLNLVVQIAIVFAKADWLIWDLPF